MKLHWRKLLWVYRSAAGGWYISIFKRGFLVFAKNYLVIPHGNRSQRWRKTWLSANIDAFWLGLITFNRVSIVTTSRKLPPYDI